MKHLLSVGLFILTASTAVGQGSKLYSNPSLPSREVLDRLNLRMAWHVNTPMDGRRDGFVSVQIQAGQVIASTRDGVVAAYDVDSGRELWKIVVGKPDDATYRPTYNSKSVLVVRGIQLYAIDRIDGRLQWQYRLPFGIASAPVADERQIYLSGINGQIAAYELPAPGQFGGPDRSAPMPTIRTEDPIEERFQKERASLILREVHPEVMWRFATTHRLDYTPTMTRNALFYSTPNGFLFLLGKYPLTDTPTEVYRVQLDRSLTITPGIHDEMAYIPSSDANLYAVSITSGRTRWRYSAGGSITRTPFSTNSDLYITVERKGLVRLDRETGEPKWKLPYGRTTTEAVAEAEKVLAVNNKFVYATDSGGRLLVLDRATGKQLSYYTPFRDFNYPIHNQTTDRLLLASNNGLIVCLHDREYEKPLVYRSFDYDTRPAEKRLKALQEKLALKVTEKGADALPLAEALEGFRRRHGLDIILSERAFTDAGLPSVRDKLVIQPHADNMEVGMILKNILSQVGAVYEIVGDTVQVLPARRDVATGPGPMKPPVGVLPNASPELRELLAKKVDPPATEKLTVTEFMEFCALRFEMKMDIDKAAFKAAGIDSDDVLKKTLTLPKTKGVPISQLLRDSFAQIKGDIDARGDTVFLVPKK